MCFPLEITNKVDKKPEEGKPAHNSHETPAEATWRLDSFTLRKQHSSFKLDLSDRCILSLRIEFQRDPLDLHKI